MVRMSCCLTLGYRRWKQRQGVCCYKNVNFSNSFVNFGVILVMADFVLNLWTLFLEAAPYLVVGFGVAGLLHQYLPPRFVQKHLGGRSLLNIFKASIIGTPVPLCSCGVVPVGLGLQKDGASKATAVSFLISTPENGVESISLTYSFFGLPFTLARLLFAMLVANITGLAVALWGDDEPPGEASACCSGCCGSKPSEVSERDGYEFVMGEFIPSIAGWVIAGFLISALVTTFMPPGLLANLDPRRAVPLAGLVGVPMYVCASASTPIAYGLFANGLSPGACLVFLLTGPATNSANFPVYLKTLGARTTAIYYAGIYLVSVALGLVVDLFLSTPLALVKAAGSHNHFEAGPFHYLGAVVLAWLLARGWWLSRARKTDSCSS
ncbi:MAG TPA: permease [Phycisphaerales bacterium]|nr:permease [Phycisphaerales bacterium]